MNLTQSKNIIIFLLVGLLVACSSDSQPDNTQSVATDQQSGNQLNNNPAFGSSATPSGIPAAPTGKMGGMQSNNQSPNQDVNQAQGMKVFIDPDTGEFLETAPEGSTPTSSTTTQPMQGGGAMPGSPQKKDKVYEEKQSSTPGGGTYVEVPHPY